MQRVLFKQTTDDGKYRKGELVSFDDETAKKLIKEGFAKEVDAPISVNDASDTREMRRVKFIASVSDSGRPLFTTGDCRFLPKHEADRFIQEGKAEPFDIISVGNEKSAPEMADNKMMKSAPRSKQLV